MPELAVPNDYLVPVTKGSACCEIFAQGSVRYDNPLLNNPEWLRKVMQKVGSLSNTLEIGEQLKNDGYSDLVKNTAYNERLLVMLLGDSCLESSL